jgi:gas vesicle protein
MGRAFWTVVDFAGGIVAGFAFGAIAALLLAPREGVETRAKLSTSAEEALQKPREVVDDLQSRVTRAIEEGKQAAADARAEMEATAGIGRDRKSAEARETQAEADD